MHAIQHHILYDTPLTMRFTLRTAAICMLAAIRIVVTTISITSSSIGGSGFARIHTHTHTHSCDDVFYVVRVCWTVRYPMVFARCDGCARCLLLVPPPRSDVTHTHIGSTLRNAWHCSMSRAMLVLMRMLLLLLAITTMMIKLH